MPKNGILRMDLKYRDELLKQVQKMQDEKITGEKSRQSKPRHQDDIPKKLWAAYEKAFFSFRPEENRRFTRSTEKQLGQLEQRIARKKKQENHQVLADMK
ncbi:MAG: hypothetical protein K2N43_01675, partial [Lachnospiraceae bacterium]|nr:hypothetical protein [Lachnospiraceae bacterium]